MSPAVDAERRIIRAPVPSVWPGESSVGYQLYDPDTGRFIAEGEWLPASALDEERSIPVALPPVPGRYHVYVSAVDPQRGWAFQHSRLFTLIDCTVDDDELLTVHSVETLTLASLRLRKAGTLLRKALTLPVLAPWRNRGLIRSMVRRDITARYRGSFADVFWAVLNPLLLMVTYWFVFGVVLRTRFGADTSHSGFVLYFLAGMLPWVAFSEAVGRSPHIVLEHRTYVKKLVFPVEILPVNLVLSALVTELVALLCYLGFLLVTRGGIPATAAWLPVLLVPQILLTAGLAWFFAGIAVFVRDIAQVMGFALTLWFFLTPICYPETALPAEALTILGKNPLFTLVRGYRAILLEGAPPEWHALWKLWLLSVLAFLAGYALFHKLKATFADVV